MLYILKPAAGDLTGADRRVSTAAAFPSTVWSVSESLKRVSLICTSKSILCNYRYEFPINLQKEACHKSFSSAGGVRLHSFI